MSRVFSLPHSCKLLIPSLLTLVFLSTCRADEFQEPVDSSTGDCFWFNVGGGGGSLPRSLGEDNGGFSGGLSGHYQTKKHLFSIRWTTTEEFKLDLFGYSGPPARVWDVGLLYGRFAKAKHGIAAISGGISIVGATDGYNDAPLRMGLPIEGQLFWIPSDIVGLGFSTFADVNSRMSFWGILFCIQLGQLK